MPDLWVPTDDELEALLHRVGADLDVPAAVALTQRVRTRIETAPTAAHRRAARGVTGWRRIAVVVGVVLLVATVVVAANPATREAVADWLGIGAVEIQYSDGPPAPVVTHLDLGDQVTLRDASRLARFAVRRPRALADPAAVYTRRIGNWSEVTLLWPPDEQLPPTAETGVGLLLTELRGGLEPAILKKLVGGEARLQEVEVRGAPGYWISGAPHTLVYRTPDGAEIAIETRLAGNVLLWEQGGITYRVESALDLGPARRIAESVR